MTDFLLTARSLHFIPVVFCVCGQVFIYLLVQINSLIVHLVEVEYDGP